MTALHDALAALDSLAAQVETVREHVETAISDLAGDLTAPDFGGAPTPPTPAPPEVPAEAVVPSVEQPVAEPATAPQSVPTGNDAVLEQPAAEPATVTDNEAAAVEPPVPDDLSQ